MVRLNGTFVIGIGHAWADPEGGGGGRGSTHTLKNHKNIGFLSNTGPRHEKVQD